MKSTALILFLFVIASSCTIEKRVHRRGWNVQWVKHHGVSEKGETGAKQIGVKEKSGDKEVEVVSVSPERSEDVEIVDFENQSSVETISDQELSLSDPSFGAVHGDTTKDDTKTTRPDLQNEKSKTQNSKKSGGLAAPVVLLIWALVCLIITILLGIALMSAADYGAAFLLVLFIYAMGILTLVLFFIGIITLMISLSR